MDRRQQLLDLYAWAPGICFRHPAEGEVPTTSVKTIHPHGNADHEVRACGGCVIAMEDMRREAAARMGNEYKPGHAGEALG